MGLIGKRLKISRENKKLTQMEASKLLGISNGTLSGYEREYRDPDTNTLNKMAKLYEVTTDYLLGRSDDPNKGEEKYLKDIIRKDTNFKGLRFEEDGAPVSLEDVIKLLENKDMLLGGEKVPDILRRRTINILKAICETDKD